MLHLTVAKTLSEAVDQILEHSVPPTADRALLNIMTRDQVLHSTWRHGKGYRDTSDANILVPPKIYALSTNKAWRYPPMMRAEFRVRAPEGTVPMLHLDARFGIPQYVNYAEPDNEGAIKYKARPKQPQPNGFGDLTLKVDGTPVQYRLSGDGQRFGRFSAAASILHRNSTVSLDTPSEIPLEAEESNTILRKCQGGAVTGRVDVDGNLMGQLITVKAGVPAGLIVLHRPAAQAKVQVTAHRVVQHPGLWNVVVTLSNEQRYNRNKVEEYIWRPLTLILPYLFITVEGGTLDIRPQQHGDVLTARLEEQVQRPGKRDERDFDSWLEEYRHTNGVLTRSNVPGCEDTLLLAPFGVYDTIMVRPRMGGLHRNVVEKGPDALLNSLTLLTDAEQEQLLVNRSVLDRIHRVLKGAMRAFGGNGEVLDQLRLYQWDAIQKRIKQLLAILRGDTDARRLTRVIRAPTAAGKTLVFMVNAALHVALTGERAVLIFPTRILNEDMYKRLTRLVKFLRDELPSADYRGGLLIGQSDPLFRALTKPQANQPMVQFGACPNCPSDKVLARVSAGRIVGGCPECGHEIDYMYDPHETAAYLPNLVIATPDKLFHQATAAKYEHANLRFFGAKSVRCQCGQYIPLDPKSGDTVVCRDDRKFVPGCGRTVSTLDSVSSPVGYFVFDEVHSLHGLSATLISTFLELLTVMGRIMGDKILIPVIETGTATIANEGELLRAITRRGTAEIEGFPQDSEYLKYFEVVPNRVRYRTVAMLPVAKSSLMATANSLYNQYSRFHIDGSLKQALEAEQPGVSKYYEFVLGYLFRKRDIYNTLHTIQDLHEQANAVRSRLEGVDILSGDSGPAQVSKVMQNALDKKLKLLLANLVVSMGVDIEGLNNLIMFGFPGSVTEYVQTAGRTGRDGKHAGHVTVFLNSVRPRDSYLFQYFYQMLGDVAGYFESKPASSSGVYASDIMTPNVLKGLVAARYIRQRQWMLSRKVAADLQKPDQFKDFFHIAYGVLAASRKDAVGRKIAEGLQVKLKMWLIEWSIDSGFLSEWFESKDVLLTSLREKAKKTVELTVVDTALYLALDERRGAPDTFGSDDGGNADTKGGAEPDSEEEVR